MYNVYKYHTTLPNRKDYNKVILCIMLQNELYVLHCALILKKLIPPEFTSLEISSPGAPRVHPRVFRVTLEAGFLNYEELAGTTVTPPNYRTSPAAPAGEELVLANSSAPTIN